MTRFTNISVKRIEQSNKDYKREWTDEAELIPIDSNINSNDWGEVLSRHHDSFQAGFGNYRIKGLESSLSLVSEQGFNSIANAVSTFFTSRFTENNILSIKIRKKEDKYDISALIYPQKVRALAPEYWFKAISEEPTTEFTYTSEMLNQLEKTFSDITGDSIEWDSSIGYKKVDGALSIAEVDLIKDMKFGETSPQVEKIYDVAGAEAQVNRNMSYSDFVSLTNMTIVYFTTGVEKGTFIQLQRGVISQEHYLEEITQFVKKRKPDIDDGDLRLVLEKVKSAVFGNYILESLINAEDISDIKVYSAKHIRVHCKGQRMTTNVSFIDNEDYMRFLNMLAIRYGIDYRNNAINKRTDMETNPKYILRINITTPELNASGNYVLHIRKTPKKKLTSKDLVRLGTAEPHVMEYLKRKVNEANIVIAGKGGSGKTTLANALIDEISFDKSILASQETTELFSTVHPDFMNQRVVEDSEYRKGYSMQDECRNAMLVDLDHLILGEIKGPEALDFLTSSISGHKSMCTLHGSDSVTAMDELANYIVRASKYSKEEVMEMLKCINVVIYMEHYKIMEISEITGYDSEKRRLVFRLIYKR